MRLRHRAAGFLPLHRHSALQLVVDGVLAGCAYLLAYVLRFDSGMAHRYQALRDDTLWWAPALGRWVARETRGRYRVPSDGPGWGSELLEDHARWVLLDAT